MFTIYAASAGSGKTFTLTKEFLRLALSSYPDDTGNYRFSPFYFQHILAVTFTNDAAHEMKKRIMDTLEALSRFDDLSPERKKKTEALRGLLLQEVAGDTPGVPVTAEELKSRAHATFQRLLHNYGNLSVSTIDSFTQRVVAAFTEELDIPYNFEVNLDSDLLIAAAVENTLARVGREEFSQLTSVLEDLVGDLADQGKSWKSLENELSQVGRKILEDKHRDALDKLAELTSDDFWTIRRQLRGYVRTQDEAYKELGESAAVIFESAGLVVEDFSYGASGAAGFLQKIADGEKKLTDAPSSRLAKAVEEGKGWIGAKAPAAVQARFREIEDALREAALRVLTHQEGEREKYILCLELDRHLHKLALLKQLSDEVRSIEEQSGQIHISRFNQSILRIVLEEPVPFLYERLGEKYHHILIDEFQDTSQLQWLNFMPLIDNSLAGGYYNLLVGDAKQSIYRFRGGEMEQLVYLFRREDLTPMLPAGNEINWNVGDRLLHLKGHLEPRVLDFNRRSTKEVVEFNNAFLAYILAQEVDAGWTVTPRIYETFFQRTPDSPRSGGHVQVDFLAEDRPTPDFVWQQIEECLALGYQARDIAILTRKNRHARELADALRHKIRIVSADSLLVSASGAVNLVVAFLRLLESPRQALTQYEAAYLFLKNLLAQVPDETVNAEIRRVVESDEPQAFWDWLRKHGHDLQPGRLRRLDLYSLCEQLMEQFGLFDEETELPYLFRFLDYVQDFVGRKSGSLIDWLADWEQQKHRLCVSTPEGEDAVTIQSIHKSKGLEYPVVLLPYANWSFTPGFRDEIWGDLEETAYAELAVNEGDTSRRLRTAPFSLTTKLRDTFLGPAYEREREQTFLDNLNLLYVALTRPVERLYISMEARMTKRGDSLKDTVGQFFAGYLGSREGTHIIYQGEPPAPRKTEDTSGSKWIVPEVVSVDRSDSMRLRRQTDRLTELDSFHLQKEWGNKAHAAMREIRVPADVPDVIDRMKKRGLLDEQQVSRLTESIHTILSHPEMKPYFELPAEFLSEQEILMPDGQILRPDRVVIRPDKTVAILDYKTGKPRESHRDQVKSYARRYRQMGYGTVECWLVYLESGEVIRVD